MGNAWTSFAEVIEETFGVLCVINGWTVVGLLGVLTVGVLTGVDD